MRCLTEHEQDTFREDFREKEREIQRYIGVYLSGLVLVTGWVVGPQTKPLIKMALDNYGYNVYALLTLVALNILFTCFLIYKSVNIHEIMQFVTYHSHPESGFQYWESWHRSDQSATKRVRAVYTVLLGILPLCVSFFILFGIWKLLNSDPHMLAERLREIESHTLTPPSSAGGASPIYTVATANQLIAVFATVRLWFWVVVGLHAIPLWFFFENVVPTDRRWKVINSLHPPGSMYKDLKATTPCTPGNLQSPKEDNQSERSQEPLRVRQREESSVSARKERTRDRAGKEPKQNKK